MKKLHKVFLAGLCLGLITTQQSFSQTSLPFQVVSSSLTGDVFPGIDNPPAASEANVNNKAVLHFHESYPQASQAIWVTDDKGSSAVRFVSSGMTIFEHYNRGGRWTSTIRNLPIDKVPQNVLDMVGVAYPDYKIFFAQDVRTPFGFVHVIKAESATQWKTLRVTNEGVDVMEDFDKS